MIQIEKYFAILTYPILKRSNSLQRHTSSQELKEGLALYNADGEKSIQVVVVDEEVYEE